MRILYVITKANWGGAQKYVYDLAIAAKGAGHEVTVVYGDEDNGRLKRAVEHAGGIRIYQADGLRRDVGFLTEFTALFSLIGLFRKEKPDIVHLNSSKAGALGALAARLAGVRRIIFTSHGWPFNEDRPFWQKALFYLAAGITVWLSHETICNSYATFRDIARFPFVKKKLAVIPLGIDCVPTLPRENARGELAPPSIGRFWIGMISELHPTKRIEDAVRAMKLLVPNHPDVSLIVIGDGQDRAKLEGLVRDENLAAHVFFAGFKDDARKLLSAFDLFLHASLSESFGYVIAEAGCASLPVVATKVGGIPELIPDDSYGILVPPKDPQAIAAAIESLMNDPMRAHELGARLHARVTTGFSKDAMLRKTLEAYAR